MKELTPVPPADWTQPPGQQYADWLAEVISINPGVPEDDTAVVVQADDFGPDGIIRPYPILADAHDLLLVTIEEEKSAGNAKPSEHLLVFERQRPATLRTAEDAAT